MMEERESQDLETAAENHVVRQQVDKDEDICERHAGHYTGREMAACRRTCQGKPPPAAAQRQMITIETTHRGQRPAASNNFIRPSPTTSTTVRVDDASAQVGTLEEEPDRLRLSELATCRDEEASAPRRESADYLRDLRATKSPPGGHPEPPSGHFSISPPSKGPPNSGISSNCVQPANQQRASKSPPTAGQASRVTAFSVADILDPGKFGGDRRDVGLADPRPRPAGVGSGHELWTPWMHRLEMQLRAGAANVNNLGFLRGIG